MLDAEKVSSVRLLKIHPYCKSSPKWYGIGGADFLEGSDGFPGEVVFPYGFILENSNSSLSYLNSIFWEKRWISSQKNEIADLIRR